MTIRVAINGLGRIGRSLARAIFEVGYKDIKLVAANALAPIESQIHLLKYDSIHGRFNKEVKIISNNKFAIDNQEIILFNEKDPLKIDWGSLDIDIVFECTGVFTKSQDAAKHIESGAKKVIISAPAKTDDVKTIIYGINDHKLDHKDKIISVGSCTTNCLAPLAKIMNNTIGIEKGFMTTIHSYTNDQNLVDNFHQDLRRARACALSMIPTSTGAAKAIGLVLPELNGKLDGVAIRVPTANVSMVDLNFIAKRKVSVTEVNDIMTAAAKEGKMAKILQIVSEPLVSIDFNHSSYSSCFDSTQTKVIGGNMIKICSWYDNEWGFSLRMLDVAAIFGKL